MSRILVTGASGRLGANVVAALLARGDAVRCLVMPGDSKVKKLDGMDVEVCAKIQSAPTERERRGGDTRRHPATLARAHHRMAATSSRTAWLTAPVPPR